MIDFAISVVPLDNVRVRSLHSELSVQSPEYILKVSSSSSIYPSVKGRLSRINPQYSDHKAAVWIHQVPLVMITNIAGLVELCIPHCYLIFHSL